MKGWVNDMEKMNNAFPRTGSTRRMSAVYSAVLILISIGLNTVTSAHASELRIPRVESTSLAQETAAKQEAAERRKRAIGQNINAAGNVPTATCSKTKRIAIGRTIKTSWTTADCSATPQALTSPFTHGYAKFYTFEVSSNSTITFHLYTPKVCKPVAYPQIVLRKGNATSGPYMKRANAACYTSGKLRTVLAAGTYTLEVASALWCRHTCSGYSTTGPFVLKTSSSKSAGRGGYKICKTGGKNIKWASKKMRYYVNTKGGPSGALGAIKRGASVWNRVTGSSFKFIYRGRTGSQAHGKYNGQNIVTFGVLSKGTVGVNRVWYYSTGQIVDSDIRFNTRYRWSTKKAKNAFDVQGVAAHEFGHSLCLDHITGKEYKDHTMYPSGDYSNSIKMRTLEPGDKRGIQALY